MQPLPTFGYVSIRLLPRAQPALPRGASLAADPTPNWPQGLGPASRPAGQAEPSMEGAHGSVDPIVPHVKCSPKKAKQNERPKSYHRFTGQNAQSRMPWAGGLHALTVRDVGPCRPVREPQDKHRRLEVAVAPGHAA